MAFYNRKMAKNKHLTKAWRAAHLGTIEGDEDENSILLPEICDEIANWIRRDRPPRKRLSLRSFSVLLSGATRLYSRQLDGLLKDTADCSIAIRATLPVLSDAERTTLRSDTTTSNGLQSECSDYTPDDTEPCTDDLDEHVADESTVFTVTPNDQESTEEEKSIEKRDQQTQTSPIPTAGIGFNPNLPFGYTMVYDTYHSRIPSKILCSNLSENVKFLPIRKPMN